MSTETLTGLPLPVEVAAPGPSAVVPVAPRPLVSFDADDPISLYMDTGIFEQLQRVARMMAKANLVPAHLRGGDDKISDCFLVAAQAFRWRMDPFSVAQHSFVTSGKLGYEGKLIAGLINASGKIKSNLKPVYSGEGQQRKVVILGCLKTEAEDRTIDGTVSGWATANEKWKTMPDQMLFYRGAREWARRHMPEVMLGISAEEEIVEMERAPEGGFIAAPRTLAALTERLQGESAASVDAVATTSIPTPAVPAGLMPSPMANAPREPGEDAPPEKKAKQKRLGED